jgi:hypothetical protein
MTTVRQERKRPKPNAGGQTVEDDREGITHEEKSS